MSNNIPSTAPAPRPGLLAAMREHLRLKHYSTRTERSYVSWIKRYIHFHDKRHPGDMGKVEIEAFLTSLAVDRNVAAATQNQALSALLFLYREVLDISLPWLDDVVRAKRPARLPVVLTRNEVAKLRAEIRDPQVSLIVDLLYGAGLRLMEAVRLRVKDVELERAEVLVRDGKGGKDRITMLPGRLVEIVRAQLALASSVHDTDLRAGHGRVWLPHALATKYPGAATAFAWQYVFPAARLSIDPRSRAPGRHHVDEKQVQRAVKRACASAGINKPATPHTLRHYMPFLTMSSSRTGAYNHLRKQGSPGESPDIVRSVLQTIQEIQELVSRFVAPGRAVRWSCYLRKGLLLHPEARIEIDLRRLHRFVSEPQCNHRTINARSKKVHGHRVPQAVNSDALLL